MTLAFKNQGFAFYKAVPLTDLWKAIIIIIQVAFCIVSSITGYTFAVPAALLVANHDQTAIVFISLLAITLIYVITRSDDLSERFLSCKSAKHFLICIFLVALAGFALVLFSPAHSLRAASTTGDYSVPGYENWSLIYKLYRGYTSTAANLLYRRVWIYFIFCTVVFLTGSTNRKKLIRLLSFLPLLWAVRMYFFGYSGFAYAPSYGWGMLDLHAYNSVIKTIVLQSVPLAMLLCIIITICSSCKHLITKVSVLSTLILSLGTRVMMGLSSTLFGSSSRTMILLIITLIFGSVVLFAELYENRAKPQVIISLICSACFGIAMYVQNSIFIKDFLSRV